MSAADSDSAALRASGPHCDTPACETGSPPESPAGPPVPRIEPQSWRCSCGTLYGNATGGRESARRKVTETQRRRVPQRRKGVWFVIGLTCGLRRRAAGTIGNDRSLGWVILDAVRSDVSRETTRLGAVDSRRTTKETPWESSSTLFIAWMATTTGITGRSRTTETRLMRCSWGRSNNCSHFCTRRLLPNSNSTRLFRQRRTSSKRIRSLGFSHSPTVKFLSMAQFITKRGLTTSSVGSTSTSRLDLTFWRSDRKIFKYVPRSTLASELSEKGCTFIQIFGKISNQSREHQRKPPICSVVK